MGIEECYEDNFEERKGASAFSFNGLASKGTQQNQEQIQNMGVHLN